jgi:hypothetical protein
MKKFTLLLGLFALVATGMTQGQNLKGDGQTFWSETFDWANPDDPRGWSAPEGYVFIDSAGFGFNWHWWPNDSLDAGFTKEPPFQSTTKDDGHLCLFLNWYNDLTNGFGNDRDNVDNAIQFPTIDCSAHGSVVLEFETHMMNYSTGWEMIVEVSNDGGMRWGRWDAGFGLGHKERPEDKAPGQPALFQANISEIAAGMPEVTIRITWRGTSLYFWLIDDFKLKEAWDNNLQMVDWQVGWDDGDEDTEESVSYQMPYTFLGGSFNNMMSVAKNFGEKDQNDTGLEVSVIKNNATIWTAMNGTTDPWLSPLFEDTVRIAETFTPEEYGHYEVKYTLIQEEEEQTPMDNTRSFFFNVTDSVYSRADDSAELSWSFGFEAYNNSLGNGTYDGEEYANIEHYFGSLFPIYGDCEVDGVSVYIMGGEASDSIDFRYSLYWLPPAEEDPDGLGAIEWLTTETVVLDSSMFNTWVYLPFEKDGESEFLLAGDIVYAGMTYNCYFHESLKRRNKNIAIGSDASTPKQDPRAIARRGFDATWGGGTWVTNRNLMIKLFINNHENAIDNVDLNAAASSLGQNYPNPFNRSTEISYELGNAQDVSIEVTDMTGRKVLVMNEGHRPAGTHTASLDATDLEAGVYFYTLKAGQFEETKRMIVYK